MEFPLSNMNHKNQKKNEKMAWKFDLEISHFYNHCKEAPASGLEREEDKEKKGQ